jgi:hypothetical protein
MLEIFTCPNPDCERHDVDVAGITPVPADQDVTCGVCGAVCDRRAAS